LGLTPKFDIHAINVSLKKRGGFIIYKVKTKQKPNYIFYLSTFFGLDGPGEEEMSKEDEQILHWLAVKGLTKLYILRPSTTIHNFKT
jgi:hypothetical protein